MNMSGVKIIFPKTRNRKNIFYFFDTRNQTLLTNLWVFLSKNIVFALCPSIEFPSFFFGVAFTIPDGPRDSISAVASIARPMTAGAVRPQTALGRPGTAMARAAPPRIKRTKVADIDPTVVAALPQSANAASALMLEPEMTTAVIGDSETTTRKGAVAANEINEFLVEEGDEEEQLLLGGAGEGVDMCIHSFDK